MSNNEQFADETLYFEHDPTGQIIKIEKGESLNFLYKDAFDPRSKEQYEEYLLNG